MENVAKNGNISKPSATSLRQMKLPKARKRGETYTITVSFESKRYYCTRDTEKECEQWAALKLLELKTQTRIESGELKPKFMFRDLNNKYYTDVGQLNKSKSSRGWIKGQYNNFENKFGALAQKSIYDISPKDLTNWRNKWPHFTIRGMGIKFFLSFFLSFLLHCGHKPSRNHSPRTLNWNICSRRWVMRCFNSDI